MSSEALIQSQILLAWGSHPRVRLWRSNAGSAWAPDGAGGMRPLLMAIKGTPDLVGVVQRTVVLSQAPHPEITSVIAQYLGVEVKRQKTATQQAGHLSPDQRAFHAWMKEFGGIVIVARCVEDVDAALAPLGISR